jgi:sodium pump decarboxylase gamma subunit
MVVNAVYSKSELMAQAGRNTLIGMGTVFVVLIFISFIISLFKYLPALFAKKPKIEPETKPAAPAPIQTPAPAAKPVASENLMDDAELVAVITAAVYAASASEGSGAVSRDKLIVRSIKRARR